MKTNSILRTVIAALLVVSASHCFGRLGETRGQCDQRYGDGVVTEAYDGVFCERYSVAGLTIDVVFLNMKAVSLTYQRKGSGVTYAEVASILQKEGGGWGDADFVNNARIWKRPDGCTACYMPVGGDLCLTVQTPRADDAETLLEKCRSQAATSGNAAPPSLPPAAPPASEEAAPSEADQSKKPGIIASDANAKLVDEGVTYDTIAWKATFKNDGSEDQKVFVTFTFLDDAEFEIDHDDKPNVTIPAGQSITVTGQQMISPSDWAKVKRFAAKAE